MRTPLNPPGVFPPRGNYVHAVVVSAPTLVFVAGQTAVNELGDVVGKGDIETQARQVFHNLQVILEAAGSSLDLVVKTTVYLANLDDFEIMNRTYGTFFKGDPPARATVQVARLPEGALVEIDAIAIRKA